MNETYFTSDLHLGHSAIIKHTNRPFINSHFMDEELIKRWNSVVKKGDVVYIVGDFAWKDHSHYLNRLRGSKVLISGNHDKMSKVKMEQFKGVFGQLTIRIDKQIITMNHYAMRVWPHSGHGGWMLYGHSHGRLPEYDTSLSCDVGVDVWNYTPVPFWVLRKKMANRNSIFTPRSAEELEENVDKIREENRKLWI